jgi:hypothetical protein
VALSVLVELQDRLVQAIVQTCGIAFARWVNVDRRIEGAGRW